MRRVLLASSMVAATVLSLGLGGSAAETISMTARPTIVRWSDRVNLAGSLGSGRADVPVTIQALQCGQSSWRELAETRSLEGGGWSTELNPGISSTLRSVAGDAKSNTVQVQQRPSVSLGQRPPGTFFVYVNAQRPFWHKRVVLQSYDPSKRTWRDLRSVLITETGAPPGVSYVFSGTEKFRQKVAKGTLLRATLPLSQARPCYLAGYSNLLRR